MFGIRDTRMLAKAIMQRWPVGDGIRKEAIEILQQIALDVSNSARDRTSAVKALLAAEKQNQEDEHKLIDVRIQQRHAELDALAADLGIEIGVIEDATRSGNGNGPATTDV